MTSSNGNMFRVTGRLCGNSPVTGEFPTLRPVTRSFDCFFNVHLDKRLSKQSWGWWLETLSCPLWHHCNDIEKKIRQSFGTHSELLLHVTWQSLFNTVTCKALFSLYMKPLTSYNWTHCGRNKMATILQTTIRIAFSLHRIKFHLFFSYGFIDNKSAFVQWMPWSRTSDNVSVLSMRPLSTKVSENLIKVRAFLFTKIS